MVELLLATALVVVAADLMLSFFSPLDNKEFLTAGAAVPGEQNTLNRLADDQPSKILKSMFGDVEGDMETSQFMTGLVRETNLNLILKGILADHNSNNKLALIDQGDGDEIITRVGDKIAGAKIVHIDARRVILRRNGANESLSLNAEELQTKDGRHANALPGDKKVEASNSPDIHSERFIPKKIMTRELDNLPQLLKQAKTVPYTKDGRNAGFRVVQIEEGSIFKTLGLKQNDVIRSVNGIPVHTTRDALQAYQKLRTTTSIQVDILRGDRQVTLDYSIH